MLQHKIYIYKVGGRGVKGREVAGGGKECEMLLRERKKDNIHISQFLGVRVIAEQKSSGSMRPLIFEGLGEE